MNERLEALAAAALLRFGEGRIEAGWHRDELSLDTTADDLVDALTWLRDESEPRFLMLTDISGVDGLDLDWEPRFRVSYHLLDPTSGLRVRLRAPASEGEQGPELPTATALWESADWNEREVWDLMGIRFAGHADLRRILMHEDYDLGHPLQKQVPTRGVHDDNR